MILREGLGATATEVMTIDRGQHLPGPSIRVAKHTVEGRREDRTLAAQVEHATAPNAQL